MDLKILKHLLFVATVLSLIMSQAWAEESQLDKFSLRIASYTLARYDSNISLTDPDPGAGISISPQDTLGMEYWVSKHIALGGSLSSNHWKLKKTLRLINIGSTTLSAV